MGPFRLQLPIVFLLLIIVFEEVLLLHGQFAKPGFVDVLDASGIERQPRSTGAAWTDYDNDGNLDLFIAGYKTRLFHNDGNGGFSDVTRQAKIGESSTMAGVFGDYDNDGCPDLFLVGNGPSQDLLYHSDCNGTFTDFTEPAEIRKESYIGYGAAWGDYDSDGFLDLYVANYGINLTKDEYHSQPNILYHNRGSGTFEDTTEKAGVAGKSACGVESPWVRLHKVIGGSYKQSYQPIWFDYDNDGKIDLFISTDGGVSPLYRNDGDGTFTEVTKEAGLCRMGTGMGVAVGDYDNDGDLDMYVTNIGANYFWRNNSDGSFSEIAVETGTADHLSIGWGTHFFDYDNDGDLDLYVINGTALGEEDNPEVGKRKEDKLYKNNGNGTFIDVGLEESIEADFAKEGGAFGDYNNDGFTDIYVVTSSLLHESNDWLYQSRPNNNHWIILHLIGTRSNKDAVGARVTVNAAGKKQIREVISGSSFIGQNSLWLMFGLGRANRVDEIEIRWPSGKRQVLKNVKVNQKLVVVEDVEDGY